MLFSYCQSTNFNFHGASSANDSITPGCIVA